MFYTLRVVRYQDFFFINDTGRQMYDYFLTVKFTTPENIFCEENIYMHVTEK